MATVDEIKHIVSAGEGYNAEFKRSLPAKVKEITEEVCAFANSAGGILLIGVNDYNQIVGVAIDNKKRSAIQNSLNEITPQLNCSLDIIEVEGKTIAYIEVVSGQNKPYVLSGAIYVRTGPNTQKLTTAGQMRDFFQQSGKIFFDEVPCNGFEPNSMVDALFLEYFKHQSQISAYVPDEQLFSSLRLYSQNKKFKNGAVLFFGKTPELFLENAIIRCTSFRGVDKRFIVDDKIYAGTLHNQYNQSLEWIRGKLNVGYDIEGQGGGPRKEIWEIPENVFKELIINSLSHRDYYEKGAITTIEVFDNRVEVTNPGGLVSAISELEFGRRSYTRNPLIFGLFAKMRLVEQVGSGISRVRNLMSDSGLPEPQFQKKGIFTVVLSRPKISSLKGSQKSSHKSSHKIIELIAETPSISTEQMAEAIGISRRAIAKNIALLKKAGRLKRVGPKKSGYWQVVDD